MGQSFWKTTNMENYLYNDVIYIILCKICDHLFISVTLKANATNISYGSSVVLTATIKSAVPVDTVKWQKGETTIDITQEKYRQSNVVSNKVTLTITNLVPNDDGSYKVQVNNSAGITSTWSTPVTLIVTGGTVLHE